MKQNQNQEKVMALGKSCGPIILLHWEKVMAPFSQRRGKKSWRHFDSRIATNGCGVP